MLGRKRKTYKNMEQKMNDSNLKPLWKEEQKPTLETENKNDAPICPFCKKRMTLRKFFDGEQGFSCDCIVSKKDPRSLISEVN